MNRYVSFARTGGPEVLELREEPVPQPGPREVLVRNNAIGFNFIDTYHRMGRYPVPYLPYRPGSEGAGIIEAIGSEVSEAVGLKTGDRVAYIASKTYSDYTVADVDWVAKIPDSISFDVAAASLLKGLTVRALLQVYAPRKDEIVLAHAGAGGLGLIFSQWASSLGARVITTVSTDAKAELAKKHGAWQVLKYTDDIPARVSELTDGKKVKVVYDSVGKDTWEISLDCLAKRGLLISYGNASGNIDNVDLSILTTKGSISVTRPGFFHFIDGPDDYRKQVAEFYELVANGTIRIEIGQTFKLENVSELHEKADNRQTKGSTVIVP